jgi:hypothetical protein
MWAKHNISTLIVSNQIKFYSSISTYLQNNHITWVSLGMKTAIQWRPNTSHQAAGWGVEWQKHKIMIQTNRWTKHTDVYNNIYTIIYISYYIYIFLSWLPGLYSDPVPRHICKHFLLGKITCKIKQLFHNYSPSSHINRRTK